MTPLKPAFLMPAYLKYGCPQHGPDSKCEVVGAQHQHCGWRNNNYHSPYLVTSNAYDVELTLRCRTVVKFFDIDNTKDLFVKDPPWVIEGGVGELWV